METYTFTIKIAPTDMVNLKNGGYRLCIVCRLKDAPGDVIWYAADDYMQMNQIELADEYAVFASMSFVPGEKVIQNTPAVSVNCGEKCMMDTNGDISGPVTGEREDAVILVNHYGAVHTGICRCGRGIKREQICNPFFLTESAVLPGEYEFFPCPVVRIWFAQDAYTGKMFKAMPSGLKRAARTYDITVNLEHNTSPVILYEKGNWKIV